MAVLHTDKSIRPGWVSGYPPTGDGWNASDVINSREQGWYLDIGDFGIAVVEGTRLPKLQDYYQNGDGFVTLSVNGLSPTLTSQNLGHPMSTPNAMAKLVEQALTGNKLAFKALYLMVANDSRYSEYQELVQTLLPQYQD